MLTILSARWCMKLQIKLAARVVCRMKCLYSIWRLSLSGRFEDIWQQGQINFKD